MCVISPLNLRSASEAHQNFFRNVKALVHQVQAEQPRNETSHRYGEMEKELTQNFHDAQAAFRSALCDSFNTPVALDILRNIVSRANVYISSRNLNTNLNVSVIERIATWVGNMLRMFGLGEGASNDIGWGQEVAEGEATVNVRYLPSVWELACTSRRPPRSAKISLCLIFAPCPRSGMVFELSPLRLTATGPTKLASKRSKIS